MSSILDIDLDYFERAGNPVRAMESLLEWGRAPVAFIVDQHHKALGRWIDRVRRGSLGSPMWILHVDEHHDMMDEKRSPNIANFMYHAMRTWPRCRVHWLVKQPIDTPEMWLNDEVWKSLSKRFSAGPHRPRGWPKPDLVSVCSSPGFLSEDLRQSLLGTIRLWLKSGRRSPVARRSPS